MKVSCICVLTLVLSTCTAKESESKQNNNNFTELESVVNESLVTVFWIEQYKSLPSTVKELLMAEVIPKFKIDKLMSELYEDYIPDVIKETQSKALNNLLDALLTSELEARRISKDIAKNSFNSLQDDSRENVLFMARVINSYLKYLMGMQHEIEKKIFLELEEKKSGKNE